MASRRVSALYDEELASFGINIAQFSLLQNIRNLEPVSVTDLASQVELDRSTLGRNVKVLERMSLITIGQGEDQREAVLELAPHGRETLRDAVPVWESVQQTITTRLGDQKIRQLQELLGSF
jgi:DNA-binding MarR family transcriptional regulator